MIPCGTIINPGTNPSAFPPWMMRFCWMFTHCPNCTLYQWKASEQDERLPRCSACKAVRYCSEECQREHWAKQHKAQCKLMRPLPKSTELVEALEKGDCDWAYLFKYGQRLLRENPVQSKMMVKSLLLMHTPFNCSSCRQVVKLGTSINSISDPHWGCLFGPLSSVIEVSDDEFSEEFVQAKLPFAFGEMTGKYTSRYEQTLSLMQRVLHKMYVTAHPLVSDDARMRNLFQHLLGLRMELLCLAVHAPSGQILEYFHQDQLFNSNKMFQTLLELVLNMSKDERSEEEMTNDSPYKLWKTFQILFFYCLHPTHADRLLFDELEEQVEDTTLAAALSKNETSEKFIGKRLAILEGLEKGMMPYSYLLDVLCDYNRQKICGACNADIVVENMAFPYMVRPPSRPSLLVMCGLGSTSSCSSFACFQTVWENTQTLVMTLQTIYHRFALKYTPNRCDMCLKFTKKVHRCNLCLTKVYCSEQCRDEDWNLIHKEICKKEQDGRKVKDGAQGRKKIGKNFIKDYIRISGLEETWFQEEERLKKVVQTTAKKLKK